MRLWTALMGTPWLVGHIALRTSCTLHRSAWVMIAMALLRNAVRHAVYTQRSISGGWACAATLVL